MEITCNCRLENNTSGGDNYNDDDDDDDDDTAASTVTARGTATLILLKIRYEMMNEK